MGVIPGLWPYTVLCQREDVPLSVSTLVEGRRGCLWAGGGLTEARRCAHDGLCTGEELSSSSASVDVLQNVIIA
jgi:hypothetical protein